MTFFLALYNINPSLLLSEKIILKAVLKRIVGAGMEQEWEIISLAFYQLNVTGWAMGMNVFIFIERNWEEDQKIFNEAINYYSSIDYPYQVEFRTFYPSDKYGGS